MTKELAIQKKELEEKLEEIRIQERNEKLRRDLEDNYKDFKNRPSVFMLGKAYCTPSNTSYPYTSTGFKSLGIEVKIPGNMSYTYKVTSKVPHAVVTYFHNILTDDITYELQQKINKVIEDIIEKSLNTPEIVLEMLGLQSDYYFLHETTHYPEDKITEIENEIKEEQFKVIDRFSEEELLKINETLFHSKRLLTEYAKERNMKKLTKKLSKM